MTAMLFVVDIECRSIAVCSPMPLLPPVMTVVEFVGDFSDSGFTVNDLVVAMVMI